MNLEDASTVFLKMSSEKQIYDGIASSYEAVWTVPASTILFTLIDNSLSAALANVSSPRVLELACGTGFFLRRIRSHHDCSYIAGIDISSDMANEAKNIDSRVRGDKTAIDFRVGDCSSPTLDLGLEKEGFNLVMANFLFSYAKSPDEMLRMWQNVASYLKPGGTFVGLTQSFEPCPPSVDPQCDAKYGIKVRIVEQSKDLAKQVLEFQTDPIVEFESYTLLDQKAWETTAAEAGLENLDFIYPRKEHIPKGEQGKFWDQLLEHPWNALMVAHKPT